MTTYTAFVTALAALTVTGVTRSYVMGQTPPAALNAADMPAMWVQGPTGENAPRIFCDDAGWPRFRAQVVIALQATAQSNMATVWEDCVTMMDNVHAALIADAGQSLAAAGTTYTMNLGTVTVAGVAYWAVIVDVTTEG